MKVDCIEVIMKYFIISVSRKYGQTCTNSSKCELAENTKCLPIEGKYICECDFTAYWKSSGSVCTTREMINGPCTQDIQCRQDLALECINSVCDCNADRYWTGSQCLYKRAYNETCNSTSLCRSSLQCDNGVTPSVCDCLPSSQMFWNGSICETRRTYGSRCFTNSWCDQINSNLICYQSSVAPSYCACDNTSYYDVVTSSCCKLKIIFKLLYLIHVQISLLVPKLSYGMACASSIECDELVGLNCTSICDCIPSQYFYNGKCSK